MNNKNMDNYKLKEEILTKYFKIKNFTPDTFLSMEEAMEACIGDYLHDTAVERIDLNKVNEWLDSKG